MKHDPVGPGRGHSYAPGTICSVDVCERAARGRGFCASHYSLWHYHNGPIGTPRNESGGPRKSLAPFVPPTDATHIGYIAGLIDGEGCIHRRSDGKGWVVKVTMTDKEIPEWLHQFGGGRAVDRRKHRTDRVKVQYTWRLTRRGCIALLLRLILPYLKVPAKRAKALAMLEESRQR